VNNKFSKKEYDELLNKILESKEIKDALQPYRFMMFQLQDIDFAVSETVPVIAGLESTIIKLTEMVEQLKGYVEFVEEDEVE